MRITKDNSLALIIDVQEKLFPYIAENLQLVENIKRLIEGLKILEIPMFVTEQYRKGLGLTVEEISKTFEKFDSMEKTSFSCCDDDSIQQLLTSRNKKFVIVCGIESHICVLQTTIDLIQKGFLPVVVTDCISSRSLYNKQIALERMKYEGAVLATYESILFELCRFAGNDQFRAISRLVK